MPELGGKVVERGGHVVEPPSLWSDRVEATRWGDRGPRVDPDTGPMVVGGTGRNAVVTHPLPITVDA